MFLCLILVTGAANTMPPDGPGASWLRDQTYRSFISNPCVTLSDRHSSLGCRTLPDGVNGALVALRSEADVDSVLSQGGLLTPLAVLLSSQAASARVMARLVASDSHVAGILIGNGDPPPEGFSPAETHPNQAFGLYPSSNKVWNKGGTGWNVKNVGTPMFSLSASETATFEAMVDESTSGGRQWGVEFVLQMKTDTDSSTCLRRNWCGLYGGTSLVASLSNASDVMQADQVIAVVAGLDSAGLFQTQTPGAVSDLSGAVALMGAFEALAGRYGTSVAPQRPAVFHWFSAEAYGYGGSQNFVEALEKGQAPYKQAALWGLLEAKQVAASKSPGLHLHQDLQSPAGGPLSEALTTAATALHLPLTALPAGELPPASVQSFLAKNHLRRTVPTLVLADHNSAGYVNHLYQSRYDMAARANATLLCEAASLLASALARLQGYPGADSAPPLHANCTRVTELLSCVSGNWRCALFQEYLPFMKDAPEFPSNYAGVFQGNSVMRPPTKLFHDIVTELNTPHIIGNISCTRNGECPEAGSTYVCIRGRCVDQTSSQFRDALSPAFFYDNGWRISKDTHSAAFTESIWMNVGFRAYPRETAATHILTLLSGILVTTVSAVMCVFGVKYVNQHYSL